jgi:hypothetical protein
VVSTPLLACYANETFFVSMKYIIHPKNVLLTHIMCSSILSMITATQIRMAKAALKWSNTDLAAKTGLHKNTLNKAENGEGRDATFALIQDCFEAEGISFPSDNCVCFSMIPDVSEAAD